MGSGSIYITAQARRCGYEWRSDGKLLGLPLVHVTWGSDGQGNRLSSKGIIAIGQFATGGLVIAQFGTGVVCIAQFGIGLVTLAQFSIALASVAQFSLAALTIAQFAACYDGIGQAIWRLKDFLS